MCVGRQERGLRARAVLTASSADNVVVMQANDQHEATRNYRQPLRPRLPGKLSASARINLNHYWSVLEDMVTCASAPHAPMTSQSPDELDNAINENLANELSEEGVMSRFVPVDEGSPFSPCGGHSSREGDTGVTKCRGRNFWGVFTHSSPLKRKASKSIMKIVRNLAK